MRCGACLNVFLGTEYLSNDNPGPDGGTADTDRKDQGGKADDPFAHPTKAGRGTTHGGGERRESPAPPQGLWVRWGLVVAALVLVLQVLGYLE